LKAPKKTLVDPKSVLLPKPRKAGIKKTAIFDLDETLVHCVDDIDSQHPQIVLQVLFPNGEKADAGINIRPYAIDCLREVSKDF
jgi:CTD small phosphatase-like protein 2